MHGGESTTPRRLREGGTLRIKTLINIFFRCLQRWRRCRGGQDGTRGKGTRYSEDPWSGASRRRASDPQRSGRLCRMLPWLMSTGRPVYGDVLSVTPDRQLTVQGIRLQ